jgi:septal ring factor EnvC (AmiA/AmiB activator)
MELQNLEDEHNDKSKKIQELKYEDTLCRKAIEETEATLKKIEDRLSKARPLATLALLIEAPQSQLDPSTLLKVSIAFIEAFRGHLEVNPKIASNPQDLKRKLEEINRILAVELKLATRKAI